MSHKTTRKSKAIPSTEYAMAIWRRPENVPVEVRLGAGRYEGDPRTTAPAGWEIFFPYLRFVPWAKHQYRLGEPPFDSSRLSGLCDIVLLFSETSNFATAKKKLKKKEVEGWGSIQQECSAKSPQRLPFDEHDAGFALSRSLESLLNSQQPDKTTFRVLMSLATDHPPLLLLPVANAAVASVLKMPRDTSAFQRAQAMVWTSNFVRAACQKKRFSVQGGGAKIDGDETLSRIAAIEDAMATLREAGTNPVSQKPWSTKPKLRKRVYAAMAGVRLSQAERDIDAAMRQRRRPLGTREESLHLEWNVPYSLPFADDLFVCQPNRGDIAWGLARWLQGPRPIDLGRLIFLKQDHSLVPLETSRFLGGDTCGTEITDDIVTLLHLKDNKGNPLAASWIEKGLRDLTLEHQHEIMRQMIAVLNNSRETATAQRVRDVLDQGDALQVVAEIYNDAARTVAVFLEQQQLSGGHQLT